MQLPTPRSRSQYFLLVVTAMALTFAIDVWSGPEISISILYLIPVSLATWSFSTPAGMLAASVSALLWLMGERITGVAYSNDLIPIWNMFVRFAFFLIVTLMLAARKRTELALQAAREEAIRASQAKTDFVNRVTHELRTPLTAIVGFSEMLEKRSAAFLTANDQQLLRRIRGNASSLMQLIEGVLELGRAEQAPSLTNDDVDLALLLADIAADLEPRIDGSRVTVEVLAPDGLRTVRSNAILLRQIVANLAVNAVKFTESGHVRLVAVAGYDMVPEAIRVEDTGIGIPPDRMRAIFEPFEQADGSIHRRYGGAGLGLSIAMDLSQRLGCQLTAQSKQGVGSTFVLTFPQ